MSRLQSTFARLGSEGRLALIAYLTVGYPRLELTPALVRTAAEAGADAIELGIPFSDPLADGRTIQAASQQALQARRYRIAATQSVDLATAQAPSRNNHRRTTLGLFLDR